MNTNRKQELENTIATNQAAIRAAQAELFTITRQPQDKDKVIAQRKAEKAERLKAKNGLTIYNLRQAGNIVRVTHMRYHTVEIPKYDHLGAQRGTLFVTVPVNSFDRKHVKFNANGGVTYVTIVTPEGKTFRGTSICHEVDAFEYKQGVKLALEQFSAEVAVELLGGALAEA